MTRKQFIKRFNEIMRHHGAGCEDDSHALWEAEKSYSPRIFCKWFVCIKPIGVIDNAITKREYWDWVAATLTGKITCYSSDSDNKEEWWGFENKKDMTIFLLRWSK